MKVVRQVSVDDALSLAANHKRHDWYLRIVIEDKKEFKQALEYIANLEFDDADMYMKKYGHKLIQNEPEESTNLLKCELRLSLLAGFYPMKIKKNLY